MKIKEKWKTDGRKHATGTGWNTGSTVHNLPKRKGTLGVILSWFKHLPMVCFTTALLLNQLPTDSNSCIVARILNSSFSSFLRHL